MHELLREYFGYDDFRPGQEEIITQLLLGQDTLGILPTGSGKSLCYQMVGLLKEGLVVVVSPLISLMEDQLYQLQIQGETRGILLNSTLSSAERYFVLSHLSNYKYLFLSPEMLWQQSILEALKSTPLALFVVDEAHCISQWGFDFRPEYRLLPDAKQILGDPVTLALTATALPAVRNDICQLLMKTAYLVQQPLDRANIALAVEITSEKEAALRQALAKYAGSGIIYCATRKTVESLYESLKNDFSVGYYHGGLAADQRRLLQQQFIDGQLELLIATNAFGMGINKSDIRFVIHYQLSDSLENYLQEIGRAGRDGKQSVALLLYQEGDENVHRYFHQKNKEEQIAFEKGALQTPLQLKWQEQVSRSSKEVVSQNLNQHAEKKRESLQQMLAYIHTKGCRRTFILNSFAEESIEIPQNCCDFHGLELSFLASDKSEKTTLNTDWQHSLIRLFKDENR